MSTLPPLSPHSVTNSPQQIMGTMLQPAPIAQRLINFNLYFSKMRRFVQTVHFHNQEYVY